MNPPKHSKSSDSPTRQMTVRVIPRLGRFQFNNSAARWFADRAITRITIGVDPIVKAVSIHSAEPNSKSLALGFRYLSNHATPDWASFYSRSILTMLSYADQANATFVCVPRGDVLTFLLDSEYALGAAVHHEPFSPT